MPDCEETPAERVLQGAAVHTKLCNEGCDRSKVAAACRAELCPQGLGVLPSRLHSDFRWLQPQPACKVVSIAGSI
jgi:hypothetical protein